MIQVTVYAIYDEERGVVHVTKSQRDAQDWQREGHGRIIPGVLHVDPPALPRTHSVSQRTLGILQAATAAANAGASPQDIAKLHAMLPAPRE